jgi:hypothetical protein
MTRAKHELVMISCKSSAFGERVKRLRERAAAWNCTPHITSQALDLLMNFPAKMAQY